MSEFKNLRGDFLTMDLREIGKLAKLFQRMPQMARAATATLMNSLGYRWRGDAMMTFAEHGLIIRNPKFVMSRLVYKGTTPKAISEQRVTVGSIYARGKGGRITFDGWRSLQGLAPALRNRTMTMLSRGGDKTSMVKSWARLKPGSDIPSTDEAPVRFGSRAQYLIKDMLKNAPNKTFIIKRGFGLAPGLYRIKRGQFKTLRSGAVVPKIQIVQRFGKTPKKHTFKWLQASIMRLFKYAPMAKMWQQAIAKITNEEMRRTGAI